jgi:hypothetical protein
MNLIDNMLAELVKPYEDNGFLFNFYLDNGKLVCDQVDELPDNLPLKVIDKHYYPKTNEIPHGFCLYALEMTAYKGIFLIPEGYYDSCQISDELDQQLLISRDFPQLFKA